MPQSKISRFWPLRLFSSLAVGGAVALSASRACAQVRPDTRTGLTDISNQLAPDCRADVIAGISQFLITGRGGLPPDSSEMLSREAVLVDLGVPAQPGAQQASFSAPAPPLNASTPQRLVEAQGWVKNTEGEIVLVAHPPTATLQASRQVANACSGS